MMLKRIGLLVWFVFVLAVGTGLLLAAQLHRPLRLEQQVIVNVEPGDGLSVLLASLRRKGALGDGFDSQLRRISARGYGFVTGVSERVHVGEYHLDVGDTLMTLLEKLERGEVIQHSFTLVEGWNIHELRSMLSKLSGVQPQALALSDAELMAQLGLPDTHPEGWFAPDTYFFTRSETDLEILRRALTRQQNILAELWQQRAADLPYNTPYEALIMASIVEKETGVAHERQEIAGVFVQRLKKGMRLQTDPTVIYGIGKAYDGNIRRRDLRTATPYNTYMIAGLPPTPIAMPGVDAIFAALHPAATQALYFVARGDGTHQFSATLEEHEQGVRQYQLRRQENYRSTPGQVDE